MFPIYLWCINLLVIFKAKIKKNRFHARIINCVKRPTNKNIVIITCNLQEYNYVSIKCRKKIITTHRNAMLYNVYMDVDKLMRYSSCK